MDKFVTRSKSSKRLHEDSCDDNNDDVINKKRVRRQPTKIIRPGLDLDFYQSFYGQVEADQLFKQAEREIVYDEAEKSKMYVYGKWHDMPRKQVAYGDPDLVYGFSGTKVHAKPWTSFLDSIRLKVMELTHHDFNFVLINRYKDGKDHISEHRDNEKVLAPGSPIASLSLGQTRDFVLRHKSARFSKAKCRQPIIQEKVVISLTHGSLLIMNHPTNVNWYHSVPVRNSALSPRINMTFRKIIRESASSEQKVPRT